MVWSNKGILTVSAVLTMHVKNNLSEMVASLRFSINWQCKEIVSEMAISRLGNQRNTFKFIACSKNPIVYYLKQRLMNKEQEQPGFA